MSSRHRSGGRRRALMLGAGLALAGLAFRPRPRFALGGQRVLITGGTKGLGLLLARELAASGCRVAVCSRDQADLDWAGEFLAQNGVEKPLAITCDVSQKDQVERMTREVTDALGGVDVLVNNAGVIQVGRYESMELEDFETALGTMFWGVVYPIMAFLPGMLERGAGHIVNITSVGGKISVPHLLPYCSAKFAAVGFSEGLHAELSGKGIHVTTVVPGLMRTGSFINAEMKGKPVAEGTWFGLADSLPMLSIDAQAAARRIVRAIECEETELILSVPANVASRVHGFAPGLTTQLLSGAERLISAIPAAERDSQPGIEASAPLWKTPLSAVSTLGRRSVDRLQPAGKMVRHGENDGGSLKSA